ncbi:hypothetical protein HY642_02695 [Candidatus Woesearchaeota archaeon]|nr:hypothetical protein [Candidatus Woesearchaeota archaeon]
MKGKLHVYYDEEGDFLELHVGPIKEGSFRNLGNGLFERVDSKTKQITGVAIHGFKKRLKEQEGIQLPMEVEISV